MTTISPLALRIDAQFKAERRRRRVRVAVDIVTVIAVSLVVTYALVMKIAGEG